MRLIVTNTSAFQALGDNSLAAGPGQEARDTKLTSADVAAASAQLAALGGPGEIWHDAATDTLAVRVRVATAAETTRSLVISAAQSAVGVNITALTAGQVRALVAILLYQEGALDATGVVLPLAQWAR